MYEYFYKEPEDYYEETVVSSNTTKAVPVKYSYWQHDDASWIFSAGGNILLKDPLQKEMIKFKRLIM